MDQQPDALHAQHYQIKVAGHLDPAWSTWLDELAIAHTPDGYTTLTGPLVDQAALYGLLIKLRDLGIALVAVRQIESSGAIAE